MSSIAPSQLATLPAGVFVIGTAVGAFKLKPVTTAKGKQMTFCEGQVLAGETFCRVSEVVEPGAVPYVPNHGDEVRAFVVPDFKANNVFNATVTLSRPAKISVEKSK